MLERFSSDKKKRQKATRNLLKNAGYILEVIKNNFKRCKRMVKQPQIMQIKEQEYYQQIDPNTGECIGDLRCVDVVVKEIPRTGFAITYLSSIINLIDSIGNKKMSVVKYILKNMDSNNVLLKTVREIAEGSECSVQTVNDTLKILGDAGIIARKTGAVMLSPKLVHKGNAKKERFLMAKFIEINHSVTDVSMVERSERLAEQVTTINV